MKANPFAAKITNHAQELKGFCAEVLCAQELKDVCAKFHHPWEVETKRWMTREKKRKDRGGWIKEVQMCRSTKKYYSIVL